MLDFSRKMSYNTGMKSDNNLKTRNTEMVTISRAEYEQLQAQGERIAELEQQLENLLEAIRLAQKKRFGASSERLPEEALEQLSFLFNEPELCADEESKAEEETVETVPSYQRRKKNGYTLDHLPENIPVEVIEHHLSEEERACPVCGEQMEEIGTEVRRRVKIIPAQVIIQEDRYYSYACQKCSKEAIETPVVKANAANLFLPGSFATPEAAAYLMTQKFTMGTPLYRMEQELNRRGIPLSRQTMSNWMLYAATHYLTPVCEQLHRELLTREVLHADETTLQVLREPGRAAESKSYMWLYRTSGDTDKPIVLYEYQPGRGKVYPEAFLEGFQGYLHTDGYTVYHRLPAGITVVGCWAHCRRMFSDALNSLPKGKRSGSSAAQGVAYCTQLFKIEERLAGLEPEERRQQRLEQEKPVLDAMLAWANSRSAAPKSALGKALTYVKTQWPYLVNYLLDGRLELSNNRAERSIKPFVIGRKNFLFANTPHGARGSAVIFSIIQTALENGLDPYRYLTWVMHTAPGLDLTNDEAVSKLLPWNAPPQCAAN